MGCMKILSSAGRAQATVPAPGDPRPGVFEILQVWESAVNPKRLLVKVRYPHCTTFEGIKLLLTIGRTERQLRALRRLDPHFVAEGFIVARFEPTARGYLLARKLL